MRYPSLEEVPNVNIEGSFRGRKVAPGTYSIVLNIGTVSETVEAIIKPNPLHDTTPVQFSEYDQFMSEVSANVTEMHTMVNALYEANKELEKLLPTLENQALRSEGEQLKKRIDAWDEQMIQRKSIAYDDVVNFENKFTAQYVFMMNQTESSLPRVTRAARERKQELDQQWSALKSEGQTLLNSAIPSYNQKLWEAGIGAIPVRK